MSADRRRRDQHPWNYCSPARFAQRTTLEVDPLYGVRGGHDTAVVVAVSQVQGVSQFMNSFLDQALAK